MAADEDPGTPSQADPEPAPTSPGGDSQSEAASSAPASASGEGAGGATEAPPPASGEAGGGATQAPPPAGGEGAGGATGAAPPASGEGAAGATQAPPPASGEGASEPLLRPPPGKSSGGNSVGGWILVSLGALLVVAAIVVAVVHFTQRNSDGYFTSDTALVVSPGYAVTSENFDFGDLPSFATNAVGTVRITARSRDGQPIFVGIGPQSAVNGYLGGVDRNVVTSFDGSTVESTRHTGSAPSRPPSTQTFWDASASGRGQINVTWKVKGGNWMAVVMNAGATRPVSAAVSLGAKTNLLLWIALGLLVLGLIAGGIGAFLFSRARRQPSVAGARA